MSQRKTPAHPPLPATLTATSSSTASKAKPGKQPTLKRKLPEESRRTPAADPSGILSQTWILNSITYNRWNPFSSRHKYVVRYSRNALISQPFQLHELANWNGATGQEIRVLPNKLGKYSSSHV